VFSHACREWVEQLHALVDDAAGAVARANEGRLKCGRGCSSCCVDDLTIFAIEAAVIQEHHPELLASGTPHPPGACAFLDDAGDCRIYAHRPYVCRTQGLPLRWIEAEVPPNADRQPDGQFEHDAAELVEVRDICPLNADGSPSLEELPAEACWPIGPFEARLRQRQAMEDGGREERVALRGLFSAPPAASPRRLPVVG
jgi:hypothetical protein